MSLTKNELETILKDNKYVKKITNDCGIMYTDEFYTELRSKINGGMDRVEAYASFGFDVDVLGENRAYAACKRAINYNRFKNIKLVNGTIPYDEMGEMTPEEELAYLRSRVIVLEILNRAKKNAPELYNRICTSSKKQK